jgi:16S rRNA C1402 (ribose-2'-O) methylase RsmI
MKALKAAFHSSVGGGASSVQTALQECSLRSQSFDVLYEGWMEKKGDVRKNWKKRYFILVPPRIVFYFGKEPKAAAFKKTATNNVNKVPLNHMSLALYDATRICGDVMCFDI